VKWTGPARTQSTVGFCEQHFHNSYFSSSSYDSSAHFLAMASAAVFLQSPLWLATACQFLVLRNMTAFKCYGL